MGFISHEDQRLPGDFKSFPATRVLALDKVITPQHVRLDLLELRPVALIGVSTQVFLLGALNPSDLIGGRLATEMAGKIGRLGNFFFVEKVSLFHDLHILA